MKKIAIVKYSFAISGGGDRQALELALSLQKLGHKVDVFCVDSDPEKCFPELIKRVTVHSVAADKKLAIYPLAKYNLFNKLVYFFPHIAHKKHNLNALRDLIRTYEHDGEYDAINYHETEIYKIATSFDRKKNYWMLNDLFVKGDSLLETIFRSWENFLIRNVYSRHINKIIVLDMMNRDIVRTHLKRDAVVVHSGLDQHKFYFQRKYTKKKKLSILATGIFFPHRRFEDLILAIDILVNQEHITDLVLSIIGEPKTDIAYYEKIQSLVETNNLQSYIKFMGRVTEQELQHHYRTSDIFVFPNSPQTWGLAVFEAMLAGCVAIVSKGAGAHEVLSDNKTAFLVNPQSPTEIAAKIKKLKKNPELIKKVAVSGQTFVADNISWDKYAEDMLRVFTR